MKTKTVKAKVLKVKFQNLGENGAEAHFKWEPDGPAGIMPIENPNADLLDANQCPGNNGSSGFGKRKKLRKPTWGDLLSEVTRRISSYAYGV